MLARGRSSGLRGWGDTCGGSGGGMSRRSGPGRGKGSVAEGCDRAREIERISPVRYAARVAGAHPPGADEVTVLMNAARDDRAAADRLLLLIYDQLRQAGQHFLESERAGHTLTATALVHEAYLRLVGRRDVPWAGRGHFYAAAAEAMRRVLVDRARARRGRSTSAQEARRRALAIGGLGSVHLDEDADGILALDDALGRLECVDAQAAAVVRLRFFAGLDVDEAAAALAVSPRTVKRDWAFARGWLREDLERQGGS